MGGVLIAILLAAAISNPVVKGVGFASAIAAGDFSRTLDIEQKDEIGLLANALRTMIATLKSKIDEAATQGKAAADEAARAQIAMKEAQAAKAQAERAKAEGMLRQRSNLRVLFRWYPPLQKNSQRRLSNQAVVPMSNRDVCAKPPPPWKK